jgi:predicted alpha/beta-hydrolase family hydrolase
MRHIGQEKLAQALAAEDIASFRYNFPYKEKGNKAPNSAKVLKATTRAAVTAASKAAPDLALFACGRSMGGRMTSLAASEESLPNVRGLIFFGFPLYPAGKPSVERADHLKLVELPLLFVSGTRDTLAGLDLLRPVVKKLGRHAKLHIVEEADHSFKLLKRSERTEDGVYSEIAQAVSGWLDKNIK